MYQEALSLVLRSLESPRSIVFGAEDVGEWPEGVLEVLYDAGILRPSDLARCVVCRECPDGCSVEVHFVTGSDGMGVRAFTECPERDDIPRVWIDQQNLRTWRPNARALAEWIAGEMGAGDALEEIVGGRLWWLGGPIIDRRRADLFLAIGCARSDAQSVLSNNKRVAECMTPVVLVPSDIPQAYALGANCKVLSLTRLLRLRRGSLELDADEIARTVGKSRVSRIRSVIPFTIPEGAQWKDVLIALTDDEESAQITVLSVTQPRTFEEMGFMDNRTKGPDKLWTILQFMSTHGGRLGWDDGLSETDVLKRKRQVSYIRARLRTFFGIPGDPFYPYRAEGCYQARFAIYIASQSRR